VHNRRGTLARESAIHHCPLFVAAEIREIGGLDQSVNTLVSLATAIKSEWLAELYPEDMEKAQQVAFDPAIRRVVAEETLTFRGLTLANKRVEPPPADAAARILSDEITAGRLLLKHWDHQVEQWILRLNLLCQWCPELNLPSINDAERRELIAQLCHGATGYKEIKDLPVLPVVQAWLSADQRAWLDKQAPERLALNNGRKPKLTYVPSGPPYIALRIQELFEVTQTPRIAMNRIPILIHILAPSMRPVQITQDLSSFWREHYPRIKAELQRKYPKHEWR